jgi:hypothetical protein
MRSNGSGTNGKAEAGRDRPSFDEALAALGEPRDPLDKLACFTATSIHSIVELVMGMGRRIDALESEIAALKAEPPRPTAPWRN